MTSEQIQLNIEYLFDFVYMYRLGGVVVDQM